MKNPLFLSILFLLACSCKNNQAAPTRAEQNLTAGPSDFFEVANIDTQGTWLQRIFVVIPPASVNDTAKIRQVICALKLSYPLTDQSNISFFSEKRYANYKSELFDDGKQVFSQADYDKWMNDEYLGEYALETEEYQTFPASNKPAKQKRFYIQNCR